MLVLAFFLSVATAAPAPQVGLANPLLPNNPALGLNPLIGVPGNKWHYFIRYILKNVNTILTLNFLSFLKMWLYKVKEVDLEPEQLMLDQVVFPFLP